MKKLFTLLFISFIGNHIMAQTVIARWNFDADSVAATPTATSPTFAVGTSAADSGALTAGSAFSALHASVSAWSNPSGNGSKRSISSNTWAIGDYYQFQASSTGFTNGISIKFDQTGSNTGPGGFKVQYSVDGSNFTDFTTYTIPNTGATPPVAYGWNTTNPITATTFSFDLTSITALKNAGTIYFRLVDNGTVSINGNTVAAGGTGRIDNFYIYDGPLSTVPVIISAFTGFSVNNQAVLNWKTANAINFNHADIEKSEDGKTFTAIGTVTADQSANGSIYSYIDATNLTATEYYRLKIVDDNGNFKYSTIVSVNNATALKLSVYPNPVIHTISLVHPKADRGASIQVISIDGKIAGTYNIAPGATQTSFDVSRLIRGTYMVVLQNGSSRQTSQIIKD